MRRYLPSSAVNGPVWAWGLYKGDDEQPHSDDLSPPLPLALAGTSLAHAQGYPAQGPGLPRSAYSGTRPGPMCPVAMRLTNAAAPATPRFRRSGRRARRRTRPVTPSTLPTAWPGAVAGRSALWPSRAPPPVYSDRGAPMPTGPVMSPDDPRYGRPAGPPPVIYSDRPPGRSSSQSIPIAATAASPAPASSTRTTIARPASARRVGDAPPQPQQPAVGADGRPLQLSALPPEEQPGSRPCAASAEPAPPGSGFRDQGAGGHHRRRYRRTPTFITCSATDRAMRYGVRVGRDGFTWTGVQKITRKAEWPDWHPPTEMIERQPYLPRFMAGGPGNPLGARAMYLGSTVYRIHGTNQPSTIGKFVSSGCIGMLNEDVSDLFERAKVGTRVVVLPGGAPPADTASAVGRTGPRPGAAAAPPAPTSGPTSPFPARSRPWCRRCPRR